tara:strand:+ start:116 stop:589 length:474 start_codon:yes stop_codon:yes gene_type:complete
MYQSMVIKGTAQWACVHEPNDLSGKFQVDICQLDKATVKKLEGVGIEVRQGEGDKEHKGSFIVAKTKRRPKVMDAAKNIWPSNLLIGNGSTVKCSVTPFDWTFKKKSGISASLNSLMVIDFKAADMNGTGDLEAEDDGFVLGDLEGEDIPFEAGDDL